MFCWFPLGSKERELEFGGELEFIALVELLSKTYMFLSCLHSQRDRFSVFPRDLLLRNFKVFASIQTVLKYSLTRMR